MDKVYLCIDLKTFYASVECVERKLDPFKVDLIVADIERSKNTVCLAISPHMKERGIRNRCRMWEIPKYVKPIIAKPRMILYMKYSAKIYKIFLKYISKDDIHVYSIDEAFLDITNYLSMYKKTPVELAKIIMKDIFDTTGITATCGIGTNLYLTKIALDITAKHVDSHIGYLNEQKFKRELWHHTPLTDFWGIGTGIENRLHKLHLKDMYDIAHCDEKKLYKEFGINARLIIDHAKGIETCTIKDIKKYKPKSKSISNTQVLFRNYKFKEAKIVLTEMIDNLVLELVNYNYCTSNIGFYIGYSKDEIPSLHFSIKLEQETNSYNKILNILTNEYDYRVSQIIPIRRIGVFFNNVFKRKYQQLDIFATDILEQKEENIMKTINFLKGKFGKNVILRGTSYIEGATQLERNKLVGGHNAE